MRVAEDEVAVMIHRASFVHPTVFEKRRYRSSPGSCCCSPVMRIGALQFPLSLENTKEWGS